jgi:hypothetical protein
MMAEEAVTGRHGQRREGAVVAASFVAFVYSLMPTVVHAAVAPADPPPAEVEAERAEWLAPRPVRAPEPADGPVLPHGFVLGLNLGLHFCPVFPYPSGELSLFFGGALPVTPRRPGHWVALGYRGTLGVGGADALTTAGRFFLFAHRHHLAVQGLAGRRGKLAYGASFGVAAFARESWTHAGMGKELPLAVEGEGRIGYAMGPSSGIVRGVVGVQLRLSGLVFPEGTVPFPSIGLFLGLAFGRGLPAR